MKAVVLVGGEGTRLRPLTFSTPKQMLPIVEQTMIERVLGSLRAHGIDVAVLSLGYRPDAFMQAFPDGTAAGVRLVYAVEPEPLDTAGAIRFAANHAGIDETFMVVNGDVLTDQDLSALVAFHRERGAEATIGLTPVDDPSAFGVVPTDPDGRVRAFIEKPTREEAPTNFINAGMYVLEPSVLEKIPGSRRVSIERETFPALVATGGLFALPDAAYWLDTGTPSAYLQAQLDLLDDLRGTPPHPDARAVADEGWVIGSATSDGATVRWCVLGDRSMIEAGATVNHSIIGHGAVVEAEATVVDSVLLPGARIASTATVHGSIIGPRATVGRRCAVRPLSVIGADELVASGTTLDGVRIPSST